MTTALGRNWRAAFAIIAVLAALIAIPSNAHAASTPVDAPAVAGPRHIGWTYLNLNYCPPGSSCIAVYTSHTNAFSWTGTAWQSASLSQGWVYVYPFSGAWRWAWTQQTGWVAIRGGRFELRSY